MTKKKIVKYQHRSELNRECFLFFKAYRFLSRYLKDQSDFNIIYIWSSTASSDDDNEDWLGVAKTINGFVKQENKAVKDNVCGKIDKLISNMDRLDSTVDAMHLQLL